MRWREKDLQRSKGRKRDAGKGRRRRRKSKDRTIWDYFTRVTRGQNKGKQERIHDEEGLNEGKVEKKNDGIKKT